MKSCNFWAPTKILLYLGVVTFFLDVKPGPCFTGQCCTLQWLWLVCGATSGSSSGSWKPGRLPCSSRFPTSQVGFPKSTEFSVVKNPKVETTPSFLALEKLR